MERSLLQVLTFALAIADQVLLLPGASVCRTDVGDSPAGNKGPRMLQLGSKMMRASTEAGPGNSDLRTEDEWSEPAPWEEPDRVAAAPLLSETGVVVDAATNISDAQQAAMEAEMAGFPKRCRRFIQFTAGDPSANATFPLELGEVAVGMISGRQDYFDIVHRNVLRYTPRGLLIRAKGACPCSFRAALGVLRERHPSAKWYYVGDEDAIIDLHGLVRLLAQYDPDVPTMVSSNGGHDICKSCGACPEVMDQYGMPSKRAFFGGTGQIFSRGLAESLAPGLASSCREVTQPTLGGFGDLENTCATASLWQPSWLFVRLQRQLSSWRWFGGQQPNFVVAHHLCPELLEKLTHVNRNLSQLHAEPVFVDNGPNDGCSG